MTAQIPAMLLGAFLVVCGVLAAGLSDRLRGARGRDRTERAQPRTPRAREADAPSTGGFGSGSVYPNPATAALADDVELALVTLGYSKGAAAFATATCTGAERATLASWTRAALRNCKPKDAAS